MSPTASPSPPTGLMPRFSRLIEAITWGLGDSLERQRRYGWGEAWLLPLAGLLGRYLARTLTRFTALHACFLAGTLPAAPCRGSTPRPATEGATADRPRAVRRPPAIPLGPVFIEYGMRAFELELRRLLDDPEMRAFLAAAPQAGRLLRPLWRKLTTEKLPDMLRLPPRPRSPQPARSAEAPTAPGLRGVTFPDGSKASSARPPAAAREAPRPPGPDRPPRGYRWAGALLMR